MSKSRKLFGLLGAFAAMALAGPVLAAASDEPQGDNGQLGAQVESQENQLGVDEPQGDNNQLGAQVESQENQLGE